MHVEVTCILEVVDSQTCISVGSASIESTNWNENIQKKFYTEHAQTFPLWLFPKQHSLTMIYVAFPL